MKTRKVNTGVHVAQEPHTAEDCRINEVPHNHPDTDCGHHVNEGPDTVRKGDLNTYTVDHGKKAIVADSPRHNLDQDPTKGPDVE